MMSGGVALCVVCGMIHGTALGQCPMYLAGVEAEARGRASGEALAGGNGLHELVERMERANRETRQHVDSFELAVRTFGEHVDHLSRVVREMPRR
jgi:hypothetical protein